MVNQDPEPKILTAQADFAVGDVAGGAAGTLAANTTQVVTLFTNQANNEQCTFYGMAVDIVPLDANGAQIKGRQGAGPVQSTNPYWYQPQTAIANKTTGTFTDFIVNIMVGGNSIPTNTIEIQRLLQPDPDNTRIISFSSPVLVLYQQPLQTLIEHYFRSRGMNESNTFQLFQLDSCFPFLLMLPTPAYELTCSFYSYVSPNQ